MLTWKVVIVIMIKGSSKSELFQPAAVCRSYPVYGGRADGGGSFGSTSSPDSRIQEKLMLRCYRNRKI